MQNYDVIGKPVVKLNGRDIVRGKSKYGSDFSLPGMLFAKTCRCLFPHTKVNGIDVSKAAKLNGVVVVATAKDIPGLNLHGFPILDQPVLVAEGKTAKMVGDPIAVVAAVSEEIAEQAVKLIDIEYKQLDPIYDPEEVLKSPKKYMIHPTAFCGSYDFKIGDIETGIAASDFIVEDIYKLPIQEHAYIETESGVAVPEDDGSITIIACGQDPHYVRYSIAKSLGLKETFIRCIVPEMGGTFGGKQQISVQILIALLALKTSRPVKMVWTREESMLVHAKRHPGRVKHKLGATKDGKITFIQIEYLLDGGAYGATSPDVTFWMGVHFAGPYKIPNISIQGKAVYTNNPVSGAFRGFGGPQATVVTELQIDRLAKKLQMDPIKFRETNFLTQDDKPGLHGICLDSKVTVGEALNKALNRIGPMPSASATTRKVGRGIAVGMPLHDISAEPAWGLRGTGATIELFRDGSVEVRSGSVDMGTGLDTVLAQIAANELGVKVEDIKVVSGDTQRTPKTGRTVGSRGAYTSGNAIMIAAQELKKRLAEVAAHKFGSYPATASLVFSDGNIFDSQARNKALSMAEIAEFCYLNGINLVANSWFITDHASIGHAFVATVIDVEVDIETGETTILNCVIAHDCGRVLNPINAKAQLVGAGVQGIGYALMEKMVVSKGQLKTTNLHDYLIPTSLDIPKIDVVFIEEPNKTGPYGARGLGEHGIFVTPPALLNAIANAIDKDVIEFPATPDIVYRILKSKSNC